VPSVAVSEPSPVGFAPTFDTLSLSHVGMPAVLRAVESLPATFAVLAWIITSMSRLISAIL
jgi:hypothetical protein